jgi:ferredoxin
MRICPTNVIHPAGFEAGVEGLWTPVLNFRVGTSGCQYHCAACGHICPTSAIRAVSLDEKQGKNDFVAEGPIRLGTAFVDHGRCLPWAMDKPCIVCQENCPVSPKAIFTRETFVTIRDGAFQIVSALGRQVRLKAERTLKPDEVATGDYFVFFPKAGMDFPIRIVGNGERNLVLERTLADGEQAAQGDPVEIQVRLKRPVVTVDRCIGCGICEHECPVTGLRAIRVSAENESREGRHAIILGRQA